METNDLFGALSSKEPKYTEHYLLQNGANIYGMFFPIGTEYRQINNDWWYPFYNDALLPSYAVHFMVIRNNPNYFKLKN